MSYELWLGDCLQEMDRIEAGSVDMILCDLPYQVTNCSWDKMIPFEPLWKQYKRVIKRNGAIVLFGSEPFSSLLRLSNLDWYKYDWVWNKTRAVGHLQSKKQPLRVTENIAVFYQSQCTYNPQLRKRNPKNIRRSKTLLNDNNQVYGKDRRKVFAEFREIPVELGYPINIIDIPQNGTFGNVRLHPTQKPVALLSYLIKTYTNPGELVLDNAFGSGSTGVACLETGRRFIGIERDLNYYQIASSRLEQITKRLSNQDLPLFAGVAV